MLDILHKRADLLIFLFCTRTRIKYCTYRVCSVVRKTFLKKCFFNFFMFVWRECFEKCFSLRKTGKTSPKFSFNLTNSPPPHHHHQSTQMHLTSNLSSNHLVMRPTLPYWLETRPEFSWFETYLELGPNLRLDPTLTQDLMHGLETLPDLRTNPYLNYDPTFARNLRLDLKLTWYLTSNWQRIKSLTKDSSKLWIGIRVGVELAFKVGVGVGSQG